MTSTVHTTDQELKTAVIEELRYTPSINATSVEVQVDNAAVTLSGEVASLPERRVAHRAVQRVAGVTSVSDTMVVRVPAAPGASDQDLAQQAGHLLDWALDVPSNAITVDVHDHTIRLSGHVAWAYQRAAAARAVLYIKGITQIVNTISLHQPVPPPGTKATIEAAMSRNALIGPRKITVDIDGADLTLRGDVQSWAQRREAEHVAWKAAGVTTVTNDLHVTP